MWLLFTLSNSLLFMLRFCSSSRMVLLKGVDKDGFVWSVMLCYCNDNFALGHVLFFFFFFNWPNVIFTPLSAILPKCRYTNYESRKAHDLSENPRAALLSYLEGLNRQVIHFSHISIVLTIVHHPKGIEEGSLYFHNPYARKSYYMCKNKTVQSNFSRQFSCNQI